MNLFRSEEHAKNWSLYSRAGDDYVMSVSDWATVFAASMFKNRLDVDYLLHADAYVRDYWQALKDMGKGIPAQDRVLATVLITDIVNSTGLLGSIGDRAWNQLLARHNEVIRSAGTLT